MAKTIYVYFNTVDLTDLLNELLQKGMPLLDSEKKQISHLPFAVAGFAEINLYSRDDGCVIFSACHFTENRLQCGSFCLTQENDCPASLKLFSRIKKIIQQKFSYSKENACYYGPGFYNDWLNKKYCLPLLLDCERIKVANNKIENLFCTLENTCYRVKPNYVRLRDIDRVDMSIPKFIIYTNPNRLVKTIIRKTFICYEYDSACIFAYKDERNGNYTLEFDRRLATESPELKQLFETIRD